jgi:hypothetical protein
MIPRHLYLYGLRVLITSCILDFTGKQNLQRYSGSIRHLKPTRLPVLKDPLPGEESNVHLAAKILSGAIVNPGEIFSQNERIGPYSESRGFQKGPTYNGSKLSTTIGGGVCKIASTLYNAAILSNLPIVERHPHGMPVPYVPYGQDATVSYGKIDF